MPCPHTPAMNLPGCSPWLSAALLGLGMPNLPWEKPPRALPMEQRFPLQIHLSARPAEATCCEEPPRGAGEGVKYVSLLNTAARVHVVKQKDKFISTMQFQCFSSLQIAMEIVFLSGVPSPSSWLPSGRKAELRNQWEKCGERRGAGKREGKPHWWGEIPSGGQQSLPVFPTLRERGQCLSWAQQGGKQWFSWDLLGPSSCPEGTSCAFHWEKKGWNLIQHAPLNPREEGMSVLFTESDLGLCTMPNTQGWWEVGWLFICFLDPSCGCHSPSSFWCCCQIL